MHESAGQFVVDLTQKISDRSGDNREGMFLFQHISVLLHRFNLILCTTVLFQLTAQIDDHSTPLATANF